MKKVGVVVLALLIIAVACGGFYYVNHRGDSDSNSNAELTEISKLINKNLDTDYPVTPREVVKLYNRIIKCYYGDEYSEDEFEKLCDQTQKLFDEQLKANNPREAYIMSVKDEVDSYKKAKKTIYQTYVCDSNEVEYKSDGQDELAYVEASYFLKAGKDFEKTYQQYVLRKDADGNWKILGYYKIEGDSSKIGE